MSVANPCVLSGTIITLYIIMTRGLKLNIHAFLMRVSTGLNTDHLHVDELTLEHITELRTLNGADNLSDHMQIYVSFSAPALQVAEGTAPARK